MGSRVVIDRWECEFLREYEGGWLLVYGRRKTGKTWLLRKCLDWDFYATVGHAGRCVVDEGGGSLGLVGLGECVERAASLLRRGRVVVLDEFQRLPRHYWDLLSAVHGESEGLLVACGSSMRISRLVFGRGSPLLGLFQAFRVDLASYADTVVSLASRGLSDGEAVLWAVVARDPWLLGHLEPRGEPWAALAGAAPRLAPAARGLVGEVFEEEERMLTRVYDAVLQLLAEGVWRAAEIAHRLHSMGLASSPQPGSATGVLGVLESMGLVERVPLWRTRGARVYYRHRSSLVALLYSVLDHAVELGLEPPAGRLRSLYGVEFQFNLGELLAEARGLRRAYSIPPGGPDVDVVLLDGRGRPRWGYEVKVGAFTEAEARGAVEWIRGLGIPRAGLASASVRPPGVGDESLGPGDIVELAGRAAGELRERARRWARG